MQLEGQRMPSAASFAAAWSRRSAVIAQVSRKYESPCSAARAAACEIAETLLGFRTFRTSTAIPVGNAPHPTRQPANPYALENVRRMTVFPVAAMSKTGASR